MDKNLKKDILNTINRGHIGVKKETGRVTYTVTDATQKHTTILDMDLKHQRFVIFADNCRVFIKEPLTQDTPNLRNELDKHHDFTQLIDVCAMRYVQQLRQFGNQSRQK